MTIGSDDNTVGGANNTIRTWNVTTGLTIKTLTGHTNPVHSLVVLQDGTLASGSFDGTIRIWNVTSGLTIKTLIVHASLALISDGALASGSWDGTIRIWSLKEFEDGSIIGALDYQSL